MNLHQPPKLAMYLLDRFGPPHHRESLSGDLFEQFQKTRSTVWVWRQVLCAVLIERVRAMKMRQNSAKTLLRIVNAVMLAAAIALGVGTLTRADSPNPSCAFQSGC